MNKRNENCDIARREIEFEEQKFAMRRIARFDAASWLWYLWCEGR